MPLRGAIGDGSRPFGRRASVRRKRVQLRRNMKDRSESSSYGLRCRTSRRKDPLKSCCRPGNLSGYTVQITVTQMFSYTSDLSQSKHY